MKNLLLFLCCFLLLLSCNKNKNHPDRLKEGTFVLPAFKETGIYSKNIYIYRKGNLQIQKWNNLVDTLNIKWTGNFKYQIALKNNTHKKIFKFKIISATQYSYDFVEEESNDSIEEKKLTVYKIDDNNILNQLEN